MVQFLLHIKPKRSIKRSSEKLWTENVGETGCIEPSFKSKWIVTHGRKSLNAV